MALKDYYKNAASSFAIPDISKGFIPQGIAYDPDSECFFLTGYMGNGKNSPIYAIDARTGEMKKKIKMLTENGEKFKGHAGGLSVYRGMLYVAGSTDACVYSFSINEVLSAQNDAGLSASQRISLKEDDDYIRASFTSVDEKYLYTGEFHKGRIFYTHDSHAVQTNTGQQKAYLFGFEIGEDGRAVPACVYSIPDSIQGACFTDGLVCLTQSHGILPGRILTYSLNVLEASGTKKVLGCEVPLYVLTAEDAVKTIKVPPMPEEIVAAGDFLYILHEAASNRYCFGKALHLDRVYAIPISDLQ